MSNNVLEAVRGLLPGIAERARSVDEKGRIPANTIRELTAAGVFRMLQPARHGGIEGDPAAFYAVVREISGACGSTGWVAAVLGVHSWHVGLFPDMAQREVWDGGPDTLLASSYAPIGRLTPVEDGFEISGRWAFSSGCEFASWALLGALVVGAEGKPVDFMTVLVPRGDYEIREVWDSMGLRGTASDDLIVERAFVPAHRAMRNYDQAQMRAPGRKANTGPLYRLPFGTVFTTTVAASVIGMAAGCYASYVSRNQEIPMELRLRARRDQVRGTERAIEAIDILFKTAGGNSLRRGHVIERAWRDAHAGSVHVANDVERALAMYGRGEFGLAVEDNLL